MQRYKKKQPTVFMWQKLITYIHVLLFTQHMHANYVCHSPSTHQIVAIILYVGVDDKWVLGPHGRAAHASLYCTRRWHRGLPLHACAKDFPIYFWFSFSKLYWLIIVYFNALRINYFINICVSFVVLSMQLCIYLASIQKIWWPVPSAHLCEL